MQAFEDTFADRVTLITGGAGALGRSYAKGLATRGAKIVINDLGKGVDGSGESRDLAESFVEELRAAGHQALASKHDISDRDQAKALIDQTIEHFGRIDVVINNAGTIKDKSFKKMDLDDWESVVRVHLFGTTFVSHAAFPHMIEQSYGRIINTTSASGLYGYYGQANYAAAKLGIVGLTQAIAPEGARHNIQVNCVAPIARSRMTEPMFPEQVLARLDPAHVTPLVLFLASHHCRLSGETIQVGAGYFARAHVVESRGLRLSIDKPIDPQNIADHLEEIRDMSEAQHFSDTRALLDHVLRADHS